MAKMVIGLGEVLWDDFGSYRKLGGAVTNFAVHAAQFGLESWVISAIGHDDSGKEAARELQSKGVMTHLSRVDFPTGRVCVIPHTDRETEYDIQYPAAWDFIPFTDELVTLARKADAVCFGTLAQRNPSSRETIRRFIEEIPAGDSTLRVFDANLRQAFWDERIIRYSMALCNILKISDCEYQHFKQIFGLDADPHTGCRQLIRGFQLKMIILTCGADGSSVFTQFGESHLPSLKVDVADTVGAGDSFTAAFISAILNGCNVCEAHGLAVRTSAFVCSQEGATPLLPEDLKKSIR